MLRRDVEFFLNKSVKLVKRGKYHGFALYGHIISVAEDSLVFETGDGLRSLISFNAIETIVERTQGRKNFGY